MMTQKHDMFHIAVVWNSRLLERKLFMLVSHFQSFGIYIIDQFYSFNIELSKA